MDANLVLERDVTWNALQTAEFCASFVSEIYADCNDQRISAGKEQIATQQNVLSLSTLKEKAMKKASSKELAFQA